MISPSIAFLGGGNMARALLAGLLRRGEPAGGIAIGEPAAAQRLALERDFGVRVEADNARAIEGAALVVLAVKPQDMQGVLTPLQPMLRRQRPTMLSIAAGLRVGQLSAWCGPTVPVVRAMPNRPALVGAGATGMYAGPDVGARERAAAERVMSAAGEVVWIDDENLMDVVTAVSGSGPAYFLLLAEALAEAGHLQGLPAATARRLAVATLHGTGLLAALPDCDIVRMRAEVTSRGGTTEAAVNAMLAAGWREVIAEGVAAAVQRGRDLAAESTASSTASSTSR